MSKHLLLVKRWKKRRDFLGGEIAVKRRKLLWVRLRYKRRIFYFECYMCMT
jgi:hypothetical protein